MEYTILRANDNGTIQVEMTIDGYTLVQDFENEAEIMNGLAVFKEELARRPVHEDIAGTIGETVVVEPKDLPVIPPEDWKPEPPAAAEIAAEQG
jgi:hypothetical protein